MEIQARVLDLDFTNGGRLILVSRSEELAKHDVWEREYLASNDNWYYVVDKEERMRIEKEKRVRSSALQLDTLRSKYSRFVEIDLIISGRAILVVCSGPLVRIVTATCNPTPEARR